MTNDKALDSYNQLLLEAKGCIKKIKKLDSTPNNHFERSSKIPEPFSNELLNLTSTLADKIIKILEG